MSAETLRRAAALMRERAENSATAIVGPITWTATFTAEDKDSQTSLHYQSWKPAVALAVADLLDGAAGHVEYTGRLHDDDVVDALAVANAYLSENP